MLNGLEVTEVGFKDLETIIDYRIEAEFFDKRFLHTEELFKKITWKPFFKIADYENGRAYSSDEFGVEGGIKVSKIGDVTNKRLIANWETLSYSEFNNQKGTKLVEDDILMSLTGDPPDVGKVNLISNITEPATFNQRVARVFLRHTQSDFISAKVFFAVLANRHCREQLERFAKGIRQRNLGIECLELLKIPIFKDDFQRLIDSLIIKSFEQSKIQQTKYQQAEALLLSELGLKDWQPSEANTAEVSLADSFLSSGRLDAEYYQPEYEDYLNKIERYSNGSKPIVEACILNDQNFNPKNGVEYKYIELADIGTIGEVTDVTIGLGEDLPTRARKLVKTGDIIISSIEGSLQKIAIVDASLNHALCSTGFYVLSPKLINTETLLVLFKSEPMQKLLKQACSGTILTSINTGDLARIPVPIIKSSIQGDVKSLIERSQTAQAESKRLLALAKEAVEVAIEQNEEAAEKLISSSLATI